MDEASILVFAKSANILGFEPVKFVLSVDHMRTGNE